MLPFGLSSCSQGRHGPGGTAVLWHSSWDHYWPLQPGPGVPEQLWALPPAQLPCWPLHGVFSPWEAPAELLASCRMASMKCRWACSPNPPFSPSLLLQQPSRSGRWEGRKRLGCRTWGESVLGDSVSLSPFCWWLKSHCFSSPRPRERAGESSPLYQANAAIAIMQRNPTLKKTKGAFLSVGTEGTMEEMDQDEMDGDGDEDDGMVVPALGTWAALAVWLRLRACAKDPAAAGVRDHIPWPLLSPSHPGTWAQLPEVSCGHRSRCTSPGALVGALYQRCQQGSDRVPGAGAGKVTGSVLLPLPRQCLRVTWRGGHWSCCSVSPWPQWHLLTASPSAPSALPGPTALRAASSPW